MHEPAAGFPNRMWMSKPASPRSSFGPRARYRGRSLELLLEGGLLRIGGLGALGCRACSNRSRILHKEPTGWSYLYLATTQDLVGLAQISECLPELLQTQQLGRAARTVKIADAGVHRRLRMPQDAVRC